MSLSNIAKEIKVSKSTVTRKISRNPGKKGYRYKQAQELANKRKQIQRYHKNITAALEIKYYFANPYTLWERGLNGNTNGLLSQYFPKKMSFINLCVGSCKNL